MGENEAGITGPVGRFLINPIAALLREAVKRERRFDKHFLTRQHEYFLDARDRCHCRDHACGGCRQTLAVAQELSEHLPGETDATRAQRERAREFRRVEDREYGIMLAQTKARSEAMKAKRDGQSARATEQTRATSIRRDWQADRE